MPADDEAQPSVTADSPPRREWIGPGFPMPPDPNAIGMLRFAGVRRPIQPSTVHVVRKGCVICCLVPAAAAALPTIVVGGLVKFNGLMPMFALVLAAWITIAVQGLTDLVAANHPGPLASRRRRLVARLLLLATFLAPWAALEPMAKRFVASVADDDLRSLALQRAADRMLAHRGGLDLFSDDAIEKSARRLADTATRRFWLLVASLVVLGSAHRILREWKQLSAGRKLDAGLIATGEECVTRVARVAHLSDLHLTTAGARLVSGGPSANAQLQGVWRESLAALVRADHVLVTGDLTDSGAGEEWEQFMDLARQLPRGKLIILPGNHDVNIVDQSKWQLEGESGFRQTVRLLRTIVALDAIQGERALLLAGGQLVILERHLDPYRKLLADFVARPHRMVRRLDATEVPQAFASSSPPLDLAYSVVPMLWKEIFPQAIEDRPARLVFLVVDSNALAGDIVRNALGAVDPAQLARLQALIGRYDGWSKVLLLHHHLALPPFDELAIQAVFAKLMVLVNAGEVISLLLQGPEVAVFHGHRHIGFRGTIGGSLQIIAAPSTSLGDEMSRDRPRLHLYDLNRSPAGGTIVVPVGDSSDA
jgi:3',5'-cyclic AMP phosphodiesterase CpdA